MRSESVFDHCLLRFRYTSFCFIVLSYSFFFFFFFFFNDTATTEIYTLSLHDALPICHPDAVPRDLRGARPRRPPARIDRKSTRLNSSHVEISYAVFCLKKKKNTKNHKKDQNNSQQPNIQPNYKHLTMPYYMHIIKVAK